eukprot:2348548-Pleurochrysis_carterae.AAC.1
MWGLAGTALRRKLLEEPALCEKSSAPLRKAPGQQTPTSNNISPKFPTSIPKSESTPSFASLFNIKWNPAAAIRPPPNNPA